MSDNSFKSSAPQGGGLDLAVERFIKATPATVFDGCLDLYGDDRPEWIVESQLSQHGFPEARIRDEFAGAWPAVLELLEHRIATER
jgi:hypothetical protein